ncbi:LysM domain-containing protein [Desulfurobacterium pacificum]|uniref:LysM domain-containing protein n=1 Tax=Desulfurobacterium pacificum TaxID=240166 RepID=A0ABY1NNI5_9BACT|nr:C40 family peptidase [Desulfurobacterium pacificum]SMP14059.1 LysM domain-containing protein [Desulfurobacterium pacificum]
MRRILLCLSIFLLFPQVSHAQLYRVKKGDSLYKIAKKFHTTVAKLKRINGLRSSLLRPGQRLIVPGRRYKPVNSRKTIAFLEQKAAEVKEDVKEAGEDIYPITNVVYEEGEKLADVLSTPLNVPYDNWNLSILENPEYKSALLEILARVFKNLKNTPYVFGGANPKRGLDCSSFTMYVYRKLGINLPRTARAQFNVGVPVSKNELKVGDLVFFRTYASFPSHVGIYIGNGKFVHFSSMYHGLSISSLSSPYFRRRFIGAKRVLSEKLVKKILYAQKNN